MLLPKSSVRDALEMGYRKSFMMPQIIRVIDIRADDLTRFCPEAIWGHFPWNGTVLTTFLKVTHTHSILWFQFGFAW